MPQLPISFPPLPNDAIASFDWYDIASGLGYKSFYPCIFIGPTYALVTETMKAEEPHYVTGAFDLDFDIEFKRACDIKGNVLINVPVTASVPGSGALETFYTLTVYIRHWDGTTETDIANGAIVYSYTEGGGAHDLYLTNALKIPITTLTHFSEGESLRVSMVMVLGTAGTKMGLDPANRTSLPLTQGAQTTVRIPFKLNN